MRSSASSEMWISPSAPSSISANAPNGASFVIRPVTTWPIC